MPWAIRVLLLPDESIASWLARIALTQGCDPLSFTGAIWPKWRVCATRRQRTSRWRQAPSSRRRTKRSGDVAVATVISASLPASGSTQPDSFPESSGERAAGTARGWSMLCVWPVEASMITGG
jgi:hypothetical protein